MTAPQASPQATPPTGALSALRATLWSFRREFLWVGALSAVATICGALRPASSYCFFGASWSTRRSGRHIGRMRAPASSSPRDAR